MDECCARNGHSHRLGRTCVQLDAIANERLRCNGEGQVALQLKSAWRDGTTHIVISIDCLLRVGYRHFS